MMNILNNNILMSIASQGGWTIAIVGWLVVFIALTVLVIIFINIPKLINIKLKGKLLKEGKIKNEDEDLNIDADVNAAISTALFLYFNELHDEESNIVTIKDISKKYTPWSSKIFGFNNILPRH
ncbi:MAG: OadG family protein [Bacteroidales bacterium]|nr:OadG family protein [Bacteroidales bacterium]